MEGFILSPEIIISFLTLSMLEIVLGIDNLIFIALVVEKLPKSYSDRARQIGLGLALVIRIIMLLGVVWVMSLTKPLIKIFAVDVSAKDILLLAGGMFLIGKSTLEMHSEIVAEESENDIKPMSGFMGAITQIALIDFVFSFDSIITAVGLTTNIPVIISAIIVSMIVMLAASGYISEFLKKYPTFKMLALSFILMIGTLLMAEGMHFHVPRGYVYFAFAFSMFVEILNNMAVHRRRKHAKKNN